MNETKFRLHKDRIEHFLDMIHREAKDAIGGKRVYIMRKDWIEFERMMSDLNEPVNKNIKGS